MLKKLGLALCLGMSMSTSALAHPLDTTYFHAIYTGVDLHAVAAAIPFEDSKIELSIQSQDVFLSQTYQTPTGKKIFRVRYDRGWVLDVDCGTSDCIAIRQTRDPSSFNESTLPQFVLFITKDNSGADIIEMRLAQGIPMTLGVFWRRDKDGDTLTQRQYTKASKYTEPGTPTYVTLDYEKSLRTIIDPAINSWVKVHLIKQLSAHLWTAPEAVIKERTSLIAHALQSPHSEVILAAIETFHDKRNVRHAILALADFLEKSDARLNASSYRGPAAPEKRPQDIALRMVKNMYASSLHQMQLESSILKEFGSTQIEQIHTITNGVLTPEQSTILKNAFKGKDSPLTWDKGLHNQLCRIIVQKRDWVTNWNPITCP
jgi:hypothetical protein